MSMRLNAVTSFLFIALILVEAVGLLYAISVILITIVSACRNAISKSELRGGAMKMKYGKLFYDGQLDRINVWFEDGSYGDGFHCGEILETYS